jgi:hypothetical protein
LGLIVERFVSDLLAYRVDAVPAFVGDDVLELPALQIVSNVNATNLVAVRVERLDVLPDIAGA